MLKLEDWQKRWEIFSDHGCGFIWFGVDSEGNIAEFVGENAYIPEAFFQDNSLNQRIYNFYKDLPEFTTTKLPENLRPELKQLADKLLGKNPIDFWGRGANKGFFIFHEADDITLDKNYNRVWSNQRFPYELLLLPDKCLKFFELPDEIQEILQPYHLENLKFEDCQFLDVSKYFYCEE